MKRAIISTTAIFVILAAITWLLAGRQILNWVAIIAQVKSANAPIAYYGHVVDQDGKPLQGAVVEFTVTAIPKIPVPWGPDEHTEGSSATDANGLFSITGHSGTRLSFGLSKSGYRDWGGGASYSRNNSPEYHHADPGKPVEFILIRDDLPKAEKAFEQRIELVWNKYPIAVDLGPDIGRLTFTTKRDGFDPINRSTPFDWSVKASFSGFRATPLNNESARIAPSGGYSSEYIYDFPKGRNGWNSWAEGSKFAILTSKQRFGMMIIDIHADGDDESSSCWITIYLNESGARNLDHD